METFLPTKTLIRPGAGLLLFFSLAGLEILFLPNVLSPFAVGITAFALLVLTTGEAGLRDFLRRYAAWRVGLRWYGAILLLPFGSVLAANLLHNALGGRGWYAWNYHQPGLENIGPVVVYAFLSLALGEEVAWRGYLLPELLKRMHWLPASLLLGLIWSAVHIPAYLAGGPQSEVSFLVFTLDTLALTVLISWVFIHTRGSIWMALWFHMLDNVAIGPIAPALTGAPAAIWGWRAGLLSLCAIAAWLYETTTMKTGQERTYP